METSEVIIKPIISEASIKEIESNKYVFQVKRGANKKDIAKAVKDRFNVDVFSVKTRLIKGRSRRMLRSRSRAKLGSIKKASVQIGKDQKIDIFEAKK
jgi:large subunit ribosomal protein L23